MKSGYFNKVTWSDFTWMNEPRKWNLRNGDLEVLTDFKSKFWQERYFGYNHNSGHMYGIDIADNFTMQACVEGKFTTQYDEAGVMIYLNPKHWLKAGIEYITGQPMISTSLTDYVSDRVTGFTGSIGNPERFWIRLTRIDKSVCVRYSPDKQSWQFLRLSRLPKADTYFVGVMCCSPKRQGLMVKFHDIEFTVPDKDELYSD